MLWVILWYCSSQFHKSLALTLLMGAMLLRIIWKWRPIWIAIDLCIVSFHTVYQSNSKQQVNCSVNHVCWRWQNCSAQPQSWYGTKTSWCLFSSALYMCIPLIYLNHCTFLFLKMYHALMTVLKIPWNDFQIMNKGEQQTKRETKFCCYVVIVYCYRKHCFLQC